MRKEYLDDMTRKQAEEAAPWASVIVKCEGGFIAFESVEDARIWKQQK